MSSTETPETTAPTTFADRVRTVRGGLRTAWEHPVTRKILVLLAPLLAWLKKAIATPADLLRTVFWILAVLVLVRVGSATVEAVETLASSISAVLFGTTS